MSGEGSPAAQAANRRLYELRAQLAASRQTAGGERPTADGEPPLDRPRATGVPHSILQLPVAGDRPPTDGAAPHTDNQSTGAAHPPQASQAPQPGQGVAGAGLARDPLRSGPTPCWQLLTGLEPPTPDGRNRAEGQDAPPPAGKQGEREGIKPASHSLSDYPLIPAVVATTAFAQRPHGAPPPAPDGRNRAEGHDPTPPAGKQGKGEGIKSASHSLSDSPLVPAGGATVAFAQRPHGAPPPAPDGRSRAEGQDTPPPAGVQGGRGNPKAASHSLAICPDHALTHNGEAGAADPMPPAAVRASQGSRWGAAASVALTAPDEPSTAPSLAALIDHIAALPPHLGWGSETLTAHLRKARGGEGSGEERGKGRRGEGEIVDAPFSPSPFPPFSAPEGPERATRHAPRVKVYPAIALGMLRREQVAAGRVWLLLRHLDGAGRGWLELDAARAALCDRASPLRLCGRRRLRQLLAEGEDLFWQREIRTGAPDRLWLRGPARVAAALGVPRLVGRPVGIPVAALRGGIGDARAHLYATFHSGRAREGLDFGAGEQGGRGAGVKSASPAPLLLCSPAFTGAPIARDTLADLSGACPRSQTAYERRAGVAAQRNIALGERVSALAPAGPAEQERAWQHGRALFRLRDHRGLHGRPGATYLAWQLPNAYGPAHDHQPRPRGQQKRINRQLADLFTKGMTGNGAARIEKRFFGSAVAAFRGAGEQGGKGEREKGGCGAARHWPLDVGQGGGRVWGTVELVAEHRRPAVDHRPTTAATAAIAPPANRHAR